MTNALWLGGGLAAGLGQAKQRQRVGAGRESSPWTGGWTRQRWGEQRGRVERGCSVAADQMIHDKLAQCTDLWGHDGR
ncbi:hypothetical protein Q5P01_001075 [Channa striata]|uniref:Uncharacterized protein n=1 Tax=Channa striata TaxID=64152 RepID=A0AA88T3K7_CHASR|nr:hypothetical protein Q5P01_001075 [Channa striata]